MADPQRPIGYDKDGNPVIGFDAEGKPVLAAGTGPVARFAKGAWEMLNPVEAVKGAYKLATGEAQKELFDAGLKVGSAVGQQLRQGNVTEAGNIALRNAPVVGPVVQKLEEGNVAGAFGNVTGMAAPAVVGAALPKTIRVPPIARSRNPEVARAMDLAIAEGVPVGTATASGNRALNRISYGADAGSIAGLMDWETPVAESFRALGGKLAQETRPGPGTTSEAAGSKLATSMTRVMETHGKEADAAYTRVREIAEQHVEARPVWRMAPDPKTGQMTMQQVMVDMAAPVDLTAVKQALGSIYETLRKTWTPAKQDANPGFTAIKAIVEGDDFAPLDLVLKLESAIGKMQRGSGKTGLRDAGEGLAAHTYGKLRTAIDDAVAKLGPDAAETQAQLKKGATATGRKWAVDRELGKLGQGKDTFGEGRDVFLKLVQPHDNNISQLRAAAQRTPGELPNLARGWLEDRLTEAFAHGGVEKTRKMLSDWDQLGQKTKELLWPDQATRQRVNDYMLAMKTWADSPNPSGTGAINATLQAMRSLGPIASGAAVAKGAMGLPWQAGLSATSIALHSPGLAKALVQGFYLPGRVAGAKTGAGVTGAVIASQAGNAPRLSSATAPPKPETPAAAVPAVVTAAGPGIHTLSDGSVWRVEQDGTATKLK